MVSTIDIVIISLTILLPVLFIYRDSLPFIGGKPLTSAAAAAANGNGNGVAGGVDKEEGDPRDFVEKMGKAVSRRG